jgi:hypothetical protein
MVWIFFPPIHPHPIFKEGYGICSVLKITRIKTWIRILIKRIFNEYGIYIIGGLSTIFFADYSHISGRIFLIKLAQLVGPSTKVNH